MINLNNVWGKKGVSKEICTIVLMLSQLHRHPPLKVNTVLWCQVLSRISLNFPSNKLIENIFINCLMKLCLFLILDGCGFEKSVKPKA